MAGVSYPWRGDEPTRHPPLTPIRRAAGLLAGLALGVAVLAGCSSEGAATDCGLDACTVTFDRGVDASATILGVEAKLIGAQGDQVTVEVAGEQLSLTVGQQATEVGGFAVTLDSVTDQQVKIRVSRNPRQLTWPRAAVGRRLEIFAFGDSGAMSLTRNAEATASRTANSRWLELLARAGFIGYGIVHLLFAWLALQIAFGRLRRGGRPDRRAAHPGRPAAGQVPA